MYKLLENVLNTPHSALSRHSLHQGARECGRPWCHKILGTDCASRPSMTGARGANSFGRSMIEMLGVLAIIGVLSVGGIAGYSKAMEKWKLDKWKEDFVMMTANLSIYYMNSSKYVDSAQNLNTLFKELNIIPQNMLNEQNQDILGNYLYISSHTLPNLNIGLRISIRADTFPGNISFEQCKMLFEMLKEYDNAWIVALNENHGYNAHFVCGKAATENYAKAFNCVPYNLAEVSQKCSICREKVCDIKFIISND